MNVRKVVSLCSMSLILCFFKFTFWEFIYIIDAMICPIINIQINIFIIIGIKYPIKMILKTITFFLINNCNTMDVINVNTGYPNLKIK